MKNYAAYAKSSAPSTIREQEALVFRLAARRLREAKHRLDRNKALNINHEVWTYVFREVAGSACSLPTILRRDCLALAHFSLHYTTVALLKDLTLEPLIVVNERMAEGLDTNPTSTPLENSPGLGAHKPLLATA